MKKARSHSSFKNHGDEKSSQHVHHVMATEMIVETSDGWFILSENDSWIASAICK